MVVLDRLPFVLGAEWMWVWKQPQASDESVVTLVFGH
jgi:hypothetical protein